MAQTVKNLPAMQETRVWSLSQEEPLEKGMANPLQYSCLENSMDRGAWQVTVCGVAKSWTQLSKSLPVCLYLNQIIQIKGAQDYLMDWTWSMRQRGVRMVCKFFT